MGAPRLLDKKLVNAQVATERKQQIDAGLQLAKKIDALREAKQVEEQNLEIFRKEVMEKVQADIGAAISERDVLQIGNEKLREERFALQAPLDLKEERAKVQQQKDENETWHSRLTNVQVSQIAAEADIGQRLEEIASIEKNLIAEQELIERVLTEADARFTQAADTKERAERDAEKMLAEAREVENRLRIREEDAANREAYLSKREEEVQSHEVDLANREQKLKRNQEVFIRAQNYIKNKK